MILEKEVEIVLNTKNHYYYKNLGYNIPIYKDLRNTYRVKRGTKIIVKIKDLSKGSKIKVTKICDNINCSYKKIVSYKDILKNRNNGLDYCNKCASRFASKKKKHDIKKVKALFIKNNLTPLFENYINSKKLLEYKCNICETVGKINYNNLSQGAGCRNCYLENNKGTNNPNWNPNLTDEERNNRRNCTENKIWRKKVYERDNYTCQCCGDDKGGNLNAHHLNGYHWDKENRFNIDNGVTLCEDCNTQFHFEYGNKENTKEQFLKFKGSQ